MAILEGSSGFQKSLHCKYCGKKTLHESNALHLGCVLTLFTCGLALFPLALGYFFVPHYRCQVCGRTRRV